MLLSVTGFDSTKTVQIRIYNVTTTTETVAWTATGVTERANGEGKSTYWYDYALVAGNEYIIDWKDNSTPIRTAAESINKMQSYIDAKLSDVKVDTAAILDDTGTTGVVVAALGTQAKLDVNAEVDAALNTAIPGSPTAGSVNERIKAIDDLTQASGAGDLAAILAALTVETFTVDTYAGNSSLQFKTNLSSSVNDFYKGMWIVPSTGALVGSPPRKVSTYNGLTKILTLTSGYTSTPADGVVFAIISD